MKDMGKNRFGLTERDMATINAIFSRYPEIGRVLIFGSRAKGNYHAGSDIDLAIMDGAVNPATLSSLQEAFNESSLPYRVDLAHYPKLTRKEFIEHIDRVGVVFYEKK